MKYPKMIISAWWRTALLVMAVAALAACNDLIPKEDYVSIGNVTMEEFAVAPRTKAAPATALPSTFSCWVYAGSGTSAKPTYMANETFTKQGSTTTYKSALKHGKMSDAIQFHALAPVGATGVSELPATGTALSSATFKYVTPDASTNQTDLMHGTGSSASSSASHSIAFSHILCQVRIHTAFDNVVAGSVTTVTLTNVNKTGYYGFSGGSWSSLSNAGSVSFTASQTLTTANENVQIGTDAQTFMLIPQTLPSTSKLQVKVGSTTYETSMSGVVLTKGRRVTLRIKFSSSSISTGNDTDAAVASPMSAPYKMFVEIEEDDIEDKNLRPQ